MTSQRVRKVVIPAAGLGTRCLPLTKAIPKELLPIFDRPGLEFIADEAVQSGIETLVLVTSRSKGAIEDHFSPSPELESRLADKPELLASVKRAAEFNVVAAYQDEPLGLGHAVGCGEAAVGDEPFAVMLPDDLIYGKTPALKPMVSLFEATGKAVILLKEVPPEQTSRYGIVEAADNGDGSLSITNLVEKPAPGQAPSNLAIIGRYVFPNSLFSRIRATTPGALGEIQLTDAMRSLARDEGMLGLMIQGTSLDTGNPVGLLRAAMYYASETKAGRTAIAEAANRLLHMGPKEANK